MMVVLTVLVVVFALVVAFVVCVGVMVRAVDELGRVLEGVVEGVLGTVRVSPEVQDRGDVSGQSEMFVGQVPPFEDWGDGGEG